MWFLCLIPTLDHMPDLPFYGLRRADRDTWPNCASTYFMEIWRKQVTNVRLRRYSRFTKCSKCTDYKAQKQAARGRGNTIKRSLIDDMQHYNQIRRYRADAAHRAN